MMKVGGRKMKKLVISSLVMFILAVSLLSGCAPDPISPVTDPFIAAETTVAHAAISAE